MIASGSPNSCVGSHFLLPPSTAIFSMSKFKTDGKESTPKRPAWEMEPDSPNSNQSKEVGSLRAMFVEYLGPIKERLDNIESSTKESCLKLDNVDSFMKKVCDLEKRVVVIDIEVNQLRRENKDLKEKMITMESQSRRDNLQFIGVDESRNENCERIVISLCESVGINITERAIIRAHRLGKFNAQRQRPIIVRFHHFKDREWVFSKRNEFKTQCRIRVNEDFPQEITARRRQLFPIIEAAYKYRNPDDPEFRFRAKVVVDKLVVNGVLYTVDTLSRLPTPLKPAVISTVTNGNAVAFYSKASPLSNHYPSAFVCKDIPYNCMEQYLMQKKALHFDDTATAAKVMESTSAPQQKALGKQVVNFDEAKWRNEVVPILMQGLRAKFGQNQDCMDVLKATGEKTLIEASEDKFWGVGIKLDDKNLWDHTRWSNNLLGKSLMELRSEV